MDKDRLITENEAACILGISVDALRTLRKKSAIPFVRISERTIRYSEVTLRAFIERNTAKYTVQR